MLSLHSDGKKDFEEVGHGVIVTDVIRSDDDDMFGGLALVVQENCFPCPFKLVGINLLFEQGITNLWHLREDLVLPQSEYFDSLSPDEIFAMIGGRNALVKPEQLEPKEHEMQDIRRQMYQHMYTNNPKALAPWHSDFGKESDENSLPKAGV